MDLHVVRKVLDHVLLHIESCRWWAATTNHLVMQTLEVTSNGETLRVNLGVNEWYIMVNYGQLTVY